MYKIIDEKLRLASCSLSDLTMQQVASFLEQWDHDAQIGGLTLFYDKGKDLLVLNKDNKYFDSYFGLAEAFLKADKKKAQEFVDKIPSECGKTLEVLRNAKRSRKIKEEIRINDQQGIVGCNGTYLGDVFNEIIRRSAGFSNPGVLMSQAYTYGVIHGKREERARKKKQIGSMSSQIRH